MPGTVGLQIDSLGGGRMRFAISWTVRIVGLAGSLNCVHIDKLGVSTVKDDSAGMVFFVLIQIKQ